MRFQIASFSYLDDIVNAISCPGVLKKFFGCYGGNPGGAGPFFKNGKGRFFLKKKKGRGLLFFFFYFFFPPKTFPSPFFPPLLKGGDQKKKKNSQTNRFST